MLGEGDNSSGETDFVSLENLVECVMEEAEFGVEFDEGGGGIWSRIMRAEAVWGTSRKRA